MNDCLGLHKLAKSWAIKKRRKVYVFPTAEEHLFPLSWKGKALVIKQETKKDVISFDNGLHAGAAS